MDIGVNPHKYFHRKDADIQLDMNINIAQATLGDEIDVPTIDGTEKLKFPQGPNPKSIYLKGKGIPRLQGSGKRRSKSGHFQR